jgi:hypothetical protein
MADNPLVGTWRLVSWINVSARGAVTRPWGDDAIGVITYTPEGYMSVTVTRPGRLRFSTGDLMAGSSAEKVAAAEGYIGYCGTYELREKLVVHRVTQSFFPNWEGTEQERLVKLVGNRLTLSTHPIEISGEIQTAQLTWERVTPAA